MPLTSFAAPPCTFDDNIGFAPLIKTSRVSADTCPPSIAFTTPSTCCARGNVRSESKAGQLSSRAPGS